jgi:methionine-rich copper-binding protein CopC
MWLVLGPVLLATVVVLGLVGSAGWARTFRGRWVCPGDYAATGTNCDSDGADGSRVSGRVSLVRRTCGQEVGVVRRLRFCALQVSLVVAVLLALSAVAAPAASAITIWSPVDAPTNSSEPDTASVEVGVKFRSDSAGTVTGIRFYKGAGNTGTHTGTLWSASGAKLASAIFSGETSSGWQQVNFTAPVTIQANTTYVASYHAPQGHYADDDGYFAPTGHDNAPLHALGNGVDGANGVYSYGTSVSFPATGSVSTNYWVDVVFTPSGADITPPTVTSTSPAANASGVATSTPVRATFSEPVQASTIAMTVSGNVTGTTSYDASSLTATFTPSAPLANQTTYTVTVGGAKDLAGNTMSAVTWSFTTAAPAGVCPCSLWPNSTVPGTQTTADNSAVEVGVRFRSDAAGYITGLRFYKGAGNTGTHVGHLWTNGGTLLSTATFSNESASGWQQVTLPTPIAISANTTYVASYYAPAGGYSSDNSYFASKGQDAAPLHAPQDGTQGANGVYVYGASGFPTFTFRSTNYWVDVVFSQTAVDTVAPTLTNRAPSPGSTTAATSTTIGATFSESVQPSTISITVSGPQGNVAGATSYDDNSFTATFTPNAALANQTTYTVTVSGAKDRAGNTMSPVSWSFTTAAAPADLTQGPGGPILLVTSSANKFTSYYAEILRTEGLNAFDTVDVSAFSAASLSGHDVVVLAETGLNASQVTALSDFVNAGGSLIAMRPDPQLAGLLGLCRSSPSCPSVSGSLSDGYLGVNTAQEAAAGITAATMQYHGPADRYTLNGASAVATLFSNATTSTSNPAVTVRAVGSNGGQAAAFTFDLARSIVLTRQGNPAWAGQERDGFPPIRSDDQFFGGSQSDWVDLSKVAIPQADEQQRLFANLVETMDRHRMPLPRLWYFPKDLKAVIVGTGDDHGNGGTAGRFAQYAANSPAGCSVADWTCLRFTSYIYPSTPLSNAAAAGYNSQGFEVGLHTTTDCADFTPASLEANFTDQLAAWTQKYSSLPNPTTNRTHCIAWSTWVGEPTAETAHGIRLDANYYYWPPSWVVDRPGFFTGSGIPMRFANTDGTMLDAYQATTQMTDESGQSYPFTPDTLLTNALDPQQGYYGAFTANMHTDSPTTGEDDGLILSAKNHNVPIVSARQMLKWLDGRDASSFKKLAWNNGTLSFSVATGVGADGLTVDLPTASSAGSLNSLTLNGTTVSYQTETIKGLQYAVFPAGAGTYSAHYAGTASAATAGAAPRTAATSTVNATAAPASPPTNRNVRADPLADQTVSVLWDTDQQAEGTVEFGSTPNALNATRHGSGRVTGHWVLLTQLAPGHRYFYRVRSRNPAGHEAVSAAGQFDVPDFGVADSRLAQWRTGTAQAISITATNGGQLQLAPGQSSGTFVSRLLDARQMVEWRLARWNATVPAGARIDISVRTGTTSTPGESWTPWIPIVANGQPVPGSVRPSRYLQYKLQMVAGGGASPVLHSIAFTSSGRTPPAEYETPH